MDIKKLVDFLFSSNTAKNVPFRIALTAGQHSGFDLNKKQTKALLEFLNNTENYNREKFQKFLEEWIYPYEKEWEDNNG